MDDRNRCEPAASTKYEEKLGLSERLLCVAAGQPIMLPES